MKIKSLFWIFAALIFNQFIFSANITVDSGVTVNTNTCDVINWTDSSGLQRSAAIVRANGNPYGYKGGYISKYTYMDGATTVNLNESNHEGDLSGLGFMINHVIYLKAGYTGRGWINSKQDGFNAVTNLVFQGANHAIYETEMDIYGDDADHAKGSFKAKWMYMIRTGNDYIVDSIGYDFSSKPAGTWGHDIRSPYCEINWTGTGASNTLTESIDGIEFSATDSNGVSWIFKTVGSSPFSGGYTYNTPGKNVPYTLQWKNTPDREAAYISTFDFTQQAAAGGFLSAPVNIGGTSSTMPPNWGINYQSNGFQNWYGDKMTWQMPYGAAGGESSQDGTVHKSTVPDWTWRKDWPAYPTNGFTLLIHFGKKTDDNARKLVNESSDIHSLVSPLTASVGTVVTTGRMNLYSTAGSFTLKPAGYNHIYHAWEVNCSSDKADINLSLGSKTLKNQTFIFNNYNLSAASEIRVNSTLQNEGVDMFTSVDTVNKKLYVTFNKTFTGTTNITLGITSATATYTNTPNPAWTATFTPTPTATLPAGSDCVNFNIDRSAVPQMVFMKKLTLKVHVGNCSGVVVYSDGVEIPSNYNSSTGIVMFTTEGNFISITRLGYSGGGTGAVTKATLYNDKKWAYSFTFDDGRPSVNTIALGIFNNYGYRAGVALNTQNMMESGDGYVMSWQSADNLRANGWSFFDHNYSHQVVTCDNIATETLPVKTAIEARWPGYLCTHFVYPYVNTTNWTCIRDSGLMLTAENFTGLNYVDTMIANPFIINRNGFMGTTDVSGYNAAIDAAANDSRNRWHIFFTHNIEPGSTTPGTYDTNQAVLTAHIQYLYNTYGAGGLDNVWVAPSDEVAQYVFTRHYSVIGPVSTGACVPYVSPTYTNTLIPGATSTYTNTGTPTPVYTQCLLDDLEDNDGGNLYGGYWYTYVSADPSKPGETVIFPAAGAATCPPAAGGANWSAYGMRITGTVGAIVAANDIYPSIGIGTQLSASAGAPSYSETDISQCVGISFYAKGDGKSYMIKVPYTNSSGATLTGYDDYKYVFNAPASWTQFVLPFSSFTQAGWGTSASLTTVLAHAKEIQWQTNFNGSTGNPASAELWLDDISIYGCPVCPSSPASTATYTYTPSNTATPASTYTFTNTNTPGGPTSTFTGTQTNTFTPTPTFTSTRTNTPASTMTFTFTSVLTNTHTPTPTHTVTASYTVTAPNTNTPTPDISRELEIKDVFTYPCPANVNKNGAIRFKFTASRAYNKLTLKVYTVSSRLIKKIDIGPGAAGENTVAISNSIFREMAAGTYYFMINAENDTKAAKLDKLIILK